MVLVKLKLRGNSQQGWNVDLTEKQLEVEAEGFLPPLSPELESSLSKWQSSYRQIDSVRSCIAPKPGSRIVSKSMTRYSSFEHTAVVRKDLNQWLNSGDPRWLPIRDKLIEISQKLESTNEEIFVLIDAKDLDLRRLPWQEWSIFEKYYPQTEIALSLPKSSNKTTIKLLPKSQNMRILVVVGRSDGINTQNDLEIIQDLENHGAKVVCLIKPTPRSLCEALWDEDGYHIFVFTGHSGSENNGTIGWIELNDKHSLNIEQFKEALREAINRGLQLAIFNSCDGLGLANQLAQLNLPHSIVMREPVPDLVAVEFFKYFFKEFSNNKSIFDAVHTARKHLEHFQLDYFNNTCFPGATWLPIVCVLPDVDTLNWQEMADGKKFNSMIFRKNKKTKKRNSLITNPGYFFYMGILAVLIGSTLFYIYKTPFTIPLRNDRTVKESNQKGDLSFINLPKGTWRYGGSTSWTPIREIFERKLKITHPHFRLKYTNSSTEPPGSGTGIRMLLNDELDFSLSSRSLKDKERQIAEERGFKLIQIPIAVDGIAVAVNHNLQIPGLTITQLRDIYMGKIRNWQQVGAPDLPIIPYSRSLAESGTVDFFKHKVLRDKNFGSDVKFVPTTTQGLKNVGANPGGIYYATASEIVPQCNVKSLPLGRETDHLISPYQKPIVPFSECPQQRNRVDIKAFQSHSYPISRPLYVITKAYKNSESNLGENQDKYKAAKAYAKLFDTNQGHILIEEVGFIPINLKK
ncbi:hypothetical protein BC008_15810 [Mastigocoleus testarum BC008]|uniref:Phosphate ABC transporter substrate-binding protein n=1 Tax=Mastigocoleus testarum BC008 TaxID=371196 RepID=A0A0V7ZI05_9CYAN|nr:hypothetical protein BC008_08975 [Mastigocoleus testarum BC008]KST64136.1 hypothetical protein BC008_15810 [Mastigocoleus testarum BC008]